MKNIMTEYFVSIILFLYNTYMICSLRYIEIVIYCGHNQINFILKLKYVEPVI